MARPVHDSKTGVQSRVPPEDVCRGSCFLRARSASYRREPALHCIPDLRRALHQRRQRANFTRQLQHQRVSNAPWLDLSRRLIQDRDDESVLIDRPSSQPTLHHACTSFLAGPRRHSTCRRRLMHWRKKRRSASLQRPDPLAPSPLPKLPYPCRGSSDDARRYRP